MSPAFLVISPKKEAALVKTASHVVLCHSDLERLQVDDNVRIRLILQPKLIFS